MTGRHLVIDGEVVTPDPRVEWTCPRCRRVRVDERGQPSGVVCAGDPVTGAAHSPIDMTRTPPPPATVLGLPVVLDQRIPRNVVRLVTRAELDALLDAPPPLDICLTCGPLVEVDNPLRREVRHRRGCPASGGSL